MTTPAAPGAPEGGQPGGEPTAPGAQEPAPQPTPTPAPKPSGPQPLGKPQAPGAPTDKPSTEPTEPEPQDVSALPDWAQKAIRDARAEAGKARTTAKQQAADEERQRLLGEISKSLGLNPDDEPTIEQLTQQLEERQTLIDELEASQVEHAYRDTVRSAAAELNADAEALLDSAGFRDAVQGELDDEFTDEQLAAAVKKVAADFAKKPRFARPASAPPRSGGEITGAPAVTKQRPKSLNEALGRAYGRGGN